MKESSDRKDLSSSTADRPQSESLLPRNLHAKNQLVDILESMGDGFISMDQNFIVLQVNRNQELFSGLPREQTVGRNHWDVWPQSIIPGVWDAYHKVMSERVPLQIESFIAHLKKWIILDIYPTHEHGIAVFFRDITKQKENSSALEESELQFRSFADGMPQLAWIAHADGYIHWYNKRWYEYTGTTPAEMEGWGWQSVHDSKILPQILEQWTSAIAQGREVELNFPLRGSDGIFRWFLTRVIPVRNSNGEVVRWFGTNTNVDEQRKLQDELKAAVRARDDFLSIASHEIKTPLTSLRLNAQLFKRSAQKGDVRVYEKNRVDEFVEQADKQTARLTRLVNDMMDVSRIRAGKLKIEREEFNLCELVNETIHRLHTQFGAAGKSIPILEEGCPVVGSWDKMRLEQVVTNLLTNAIRYGKNKPVRIKVQERSDVVQIAVKDEGMGIAQEAQVAIFNRFERAVSSNEVSGLGLGLFITKQIVLAHGGKIWVESELEKGSTFYIDLPKHATAASSEAVDVL